MLKLYSIFLCALHISTMFQRVLKSSKFKKFTCFESWTFRKMNIFFTNLYNLFFLHVLQLRATHFIFSSIFWSAKWKNSEKYFLNSKKNKTKQANVQYTWIEIVVDNRNKFHVVSLFNSKKFWGRQRKEEIYRIFVIFDSIPSLVRGDSRLLNIIIARFMDVTRAYLSLSPCLTKTRSTIDYRIIQAKRKRMHFLLSLSSLLLLLYKEENSEVERSRLC